MPQKSVGSDSYIDLMPKQPNKSGNSSSPPPGQGKEPVIGSIEERGMLVLPVTPDPQSNIDIGGLPTSEGNTGGSAGGGGSEGGSDSSSSSSDE